jgi:hypothetical protein
VEARLTDQSANDLLANVKRAHGPHCTLLVINSVRTGPEDVPPPPTDMTKHPSIPQARPFTPENGNPAAISQVYASALSSLALSPSSTVVDMTEAVTPGVADATEPRGRFFRQGSYGAKLTAADTQRLAALVKELVGQSLIPWMEARIREWNEVYHQNRRGITGRLFGAGRKFFGSRPSSPAPNAAPAGYNAAKG